MKRRHLPILLICMSAAFLGVGCYPHFDSQEPIGPNVRTNLLIFFKTDTTPEEVNRFWNQVLATPDPRGGFKLLHGICGVAKSELIQGHDSISIDYCRNATATEREEIKTRILASPIVFKVLENVIPAEVKTVESC